MKNIEWDKNAQQYFNRWKNTLHQNCKGDQCYCHEGAFRLTVSELECRRRGKHSLPLSVEDEVWDKAFTHHAEFCEKKAVAGWSAGSISPEWAKPADAKTCNCFEKALLVHSAEASIVPEPTPVVTQLEDMSYERVI
jgi:hypothetical protein